MSSELYGKRFVSARNQSAWHRILTRLPEDRDYSVEEALEVGDITFPYVTVPVGYTTPDGLFVESGSKQVILRGPSRSDPTWAEIGVVSREYHYLQTIELARGLDAIARETGWRFETVGALQNGATIFMSLRTGQRSVFGDAYDTYLIVSDGKASQRALQIAVAPVRVVCMNTLVASDSAATAKITITHNDAVKGEYAFWLSLIGDIQKAQDATFAGLEMLGSVKIDRDAAQTIIQRAFPMPVVGAREKQAEALLKLPTLTDAAREVITTRGSRGSERKDDIRKHVANRRLQALSLYDRFNAGNEQGSLGTGEAGHDAGALKQMPKATLEQLRETPYAVVQAVTELVDWGGSVSDAVAASSSLFGLGADAKMRAWKAGMEVVGA